jgi:hypothetical protein
MVEMESTACIVGLLLIYVSLRVSMKVAFSYPVVLSGTPKRSRLQKSIACLIPADVEVREYGADDAIAAFSIRDRDQKISLRLMGNSSRAAMSPTLRSSTGIMIQLSALKTMALGVNISMAARSSRRLTAGISHSGIFKRP